MQAVLATLGYVFSPFADAPTVFHGVMPFAQGKALSWSYSEV